MKKIFYSRLFRNRFLLLAHLILLCTSIAHAEKWIRVNQMGYLPNQSKVAVLMSRENCEVKIFDVVDFYTGKVLLTLNNVKACGR